MQINYSRPEVPFSPSNLHIHVPFGGETDV